MNNTRILGGKFELVGKVPLVAVCGHGAQPQPLEDARGGRCPRPVEMRSRGRLVEPIHELDARIAHHHRPLVLLHNLAGESVSKGAADSRAALTVKQNQMEKGKVITRRK